MKKELSTVKIWFLGSGLVSGLIAYALERLTRDLVSLRNKKSSSRNKKTTLVNHQINAE